MPDYSIENSLPSPVAGIDEAGRGPWAGPVVACAIFMPPELCPDGINDSKQLSRNMREKIAHQLWQADGKGIFIGTGIANVDEIDCLNILQATMLAMTRAFNALSVKMPILPKHAIIDGNKTPNLSVPASAIIKGDSLSCSIAAASIIAKTSRDQMMSELAATYPGYGWEKNSGYGTKLHTDGLKHLGITPHHRRSFAPIKAMLEAA